MDDTLKLAIYSKFKVKPNKMAYKKVYLKLMVTKIMIFKI